MPDLYPLVFKLADKKIVIIGGGIIGLRKTKGLLNTGAKITVISKEFLMEFKEIKGVTLIKRAFEDQDIVDAHIIYIATHDKTLNTAIAKKSAHWQWVNDVSNPQNSNFYTPAVVRKSGLVIGISTEDSDPKKAKCYKEKIIKFLKNP